MAYTLSLDMGLSDFAVTRAIKELAVEQSSFGCAEIASYIGCSKRTVERCLPRLIEAGMIVRAGGSARTGYRYEYVSGGQHAKCG